MASAAALATGVSTVLIQWKLRAEDAVLPVLVAVLVGVVTFAVGLRPARTRGRSGERALPVRHGFALRNVRTRLRQLAAAEVVARMPVPVTVEVVRDTLRAVLRDDALEVRYWVPQRAGYVDADGLPARLPTEPGSRSVVVVEDPGGKPVAALLVDPDRAAEPGLLATVFPAAAPGLVAGRRDAVLRAQGQEERVLHRQAMEVDWAERRALERQLHDGAQSRLSALAMRLGAARHAATDPHTGTVLDDTQSELRTVLGELREIASGIHPTMLTESGLRQALEAAVDRAPFPVRLVVPLERFPPGIEAVAYHLICQVLAAATRRPVPADVQVLVASMSDTMVIEISGRSGANPGLADPTAVETTLATAECAFAVRLRAVGGTLVVTEDAGTGTTVRVRIPCL